MMRKNTLILALILALGLALRLAYVLLVPAQPLSDFLNYHILAVNMLNNGIFGFGSEHISHLSPGTSFFLGFAYVLAGSTDIIYAKLLQAAIGTACILLVYYIAFKVFDERAALIAALIWAVFPTPIEYTTVLASENPFTFLSLLSIALLLCLDPKNKLYYAVVFLTGVIMGAAALVRPVSMFLPAIFLVYIILRHHTIKKANITPILAVTLLLLVGASSILGPWCMRNYIEFGHFSTSSNGGVNFWMGNNPCATGTYMNMDRLINETFGDVSGLTDFEKASLYMKAGESYVLAHPVETLKLDARKLSILYGTSWQGVYWSMDADGVIADPALRGSLLAWSGPMYTISGRYYGIVFLLAGLGVLTSLLSRSKCDKGAAILLILYVLYFSAAYVATTAFDRYNFNVLPVMAIFGAYGALVIYEQAFRVIKGGRA
jgi:4-amino-4-deoxy-L-arabinose transferase-like glycosyltransferase